MTLERQRVAVITPNPPLTVDGSGDPGEQEITANTAVPSGDPSVLSGAIQVAPIKINARTCNGEVAKQWQFRARVTGTTSNNEGTIMIWAYSRHSAQWAEVTSMEIVPCDCGVIGGTLSIGGVLGATYVYAQVMGVGGDERVFLELITSGAEASDSKLNGGLGQNRNNPYFAVIVNRTTPTVDALFAKSISNFTLAADTSASGLTTLVYDFTASPLHGIAIDDEIILLDPSSDRSLQAVVVDVVGDVITVDRPIDHAFPAASTLGRIVTTNMAVDGSVAPQIFTIRAGIIPRDIVRFILTILSTANPSMDDGRFGNLAALTNGLVLRIMDGYQETIFNFKTNLEIKQFCFDFSYSDAAPAGQAGAVARMTFAGQDKHGVALRISGNDAIQWIVQDDLTGLDALRVSAQGHQIGR
jgi:hypothetical protein